VETSIELISETRDRCENMFLICRTVACQSLLIRSWKTASEISPSHRMQNISHRLELTTTRFVVHHGSKYQNFSSALRIRYISFNWDSLEKGCFTDSQSSTVILYH